MINRISVKNLGSLALSDMCPRCMWLKMKLDFKLPFQMFPGIFSALDGYSKSVTLCHHKKHGELPKWMAAAGIKGVPQMVPHWSKFSVTDPTTGITFRGSPDELLKSPEGLWIPDYKTSKYNESHEGLTPMYKAQLNGYATIAEALGMGPVIGLALVYYEPQVELSAINLEDFVNLVGFKMAFSPKVIPIERDPQMIPTLLAKAKEISSMDKLPDGNKGCKDCAALNVLWQTLQLGTTLGCTN